MELRDIQTIQFEFDAHFWEHEHGEPTISHVQRHLGKLLGKISTVAETIDHGDTPDLTELDSEVIPDLLIFAARLANTRGIDLDTAFSQRTAELRERFAGPVAT